MMEILRTVKGLNLPDWWIGAGFIRSKVWDILHDYTNRTPIPDIDVIYLNRNEPIQEELSYESKLKILRPDINWSVKNQAKMHVRHNDKPYKTSSQALAQWVETATCIGCRLTKNNKVIITAPQGIKDLVGFILRPIHPSKNLNLFYERIKKKKWLEKWPKLKVVI